jgi:polysaccharide export outer membrane protein
MHKLMSVSLALCLLLVASPLWAGAEDSSPEFSLGPGDVLHISVWKDEALNREVLVRPDGKISFPLAGEVQAAGRSVPELRQELEERLKKYVPDSPVTVVLSQLQSTRIYVVGKVNQPGTYLMHGDMSVIQALALAGGFTRFADSGDITILRQGENGQKAIAFDYGDVAGGDNLKENIVLQPGDTIVVP